MAERTNPGRGTVPHPTVAERQVVGRQLRKEVRRRELGELAPPPTWPRPRAPV